MINFAKIPKNYVDEVAKKLGKISKQQLKKRKDIIRVFLKKRVEPLIDALCGTNMNEDLKNIKYKENWWNKYHLINLKLNRLLSYL